MFRKKVGLPQKMRGRFKLRRIKAESGLIVEETGWQRNVLTYNFFNCAFNTVSHYIKGVVVGSGSSVPLETQTSLDSFLAGTTSMVASNTIRNTTVSPRYVSYSWTFRFGIGVAAGNISEFGIVTTNSSSTPALTSESVISSRARILTELGVPTSITILSDEFLEIVWELTVFAFEDVTGSVTLDINGTPTLFNYTLRSAGMANTAYWPNAVASTSTGSFLRALPETSLGTSTGQCCRVLNNTALIDWNVNPSPMSSNSGNFTNRVLDDYVNNSKQRSGIIRCITGTGNRPSPGFNSVVIQCNTTAHQLLFDNYILKNSTEEFELDLTTVLG